MATRYRTTQRQILMVIGILIVVTLVIRIIPLNYSKSNSYFMFFLGFRPNNLTVSIKDNPTYDIWKGQPDDDRIVVQLVFKPLVDPKVPPKRIVVHNGVSGWSVQAGKQLFIQENCQIKNCELIDFPLLGEQYDAMMFKEIDLNEYNIEGVKNLTPRHPDQVWIMFALESPNASPSYDGLNNVINWTATYRHDSTINTPYDKWVPFANFRKISDYRPNKDYAKGKTKLAAIFVSNCGASNNRLEYIKELQQYMQVDIFGGCGTMQCPRNTQQSCFDMLTTDYKFYFAFENANCRDYITEKLFLNALRQDVLPVVMGAHPEDYKRVAPPESYIHVEWFNNPRELAKFLKELDNDDKRYNDYFRWKSAGSFISTKFWCRICSMLWDPNRPRLSVSNLDDWWRGANTCIGKERWLSKSDTIPLNT